MSKADIAKLLSKASAPKSKYRAQPVVIDGIRFASKKEGARYVQLKALEKVGDIVGLSLQPRYELFSSALDTAIKVGEYVADFRYIDGASGEVIIEDVKSPATRTPLYKLKKKIAEACHGITITEV